MQQIGEATVNYREPTPGAPVNDPPFRVDIAVHGERFGAFGDSIGAALHHLALHVMEYERRQAAAAKGQATKRGRR